MERAPRFHYYPPSEEIWNVGRGGVKSFEKKCDPKIIIYLVLLKSFISITSLSFKIEPPLLRQCVSVCSSASCLNNYESRIFKLGCTPLFMPKARLQTDERILPSNLSRESGSPPHLQVPPPLSRLLIGRMDPRLNGGDLFNLMIVKAMEIFDSPSS